MMQLVPCVVCGSVEIDLGEEFVEVHFKAIGKQCELCYDTSRSERVVHICSLKCFAAYCKQLSKGKR